jgi:hypothetical protein
MTTARTIWSAKAVSIVLQTHHREIHTKPQEEKPVSDGRTRRVPQDQVQPKEQERESSTIVASGLGCKEMPKVGRHVLVRVLATHHGSGQNRVGGRQACSDYQ